MGYIEKSLLPGELIVHKAKIHWFILMRGAIYGMSGLFLILSGVAVAAEYSEGSPGAIIALLGVLLMGASPFMVLGALIERITTELGVTNRRVITKVGMIRRRTIELNHSQVESLTVDQSILGRILGFGTVMVNGSGGITAPVRYVSAPIKFRRNVMGAIDMLDT